jgi:hypothetical protein
MSNINQLIVEGCFTVDAASPTGTSFQNLSHQSVRVKQDLRTDATYSRGTIYRAPTNGDLDVNLRKSCQVFSSGRVDV